MLLMPVFLGLDSRLGSTVGMGGTKHLPDGDDRDHTSGCRRVAADADDARGVGVGVKQGAKNGADARASCWQSRDAPAEYPSCMVLRFDFNNCSKHAK